nr:allophanate hydrolase subunit 1 [Ilumatobacter coccineus]
MTDARSPIYPGDVPRFVPVADHGLLVEFVGDDAHHDRDEAAEGRANDAVVALDQAIAAAAIPGVVDVVPALVNLLVAFDPLVTDHVTVEAGVRSVLDGLVSVRRTPAVHRVPVCYDEAVAPDLGAVADACGLSTEAVIDAHLAGDYRVVMYGFAPGYAYLGGVRPEIQVPRKTSPVRGVAAGSVIIAGPQCLITTLTMPTGWSVIGASPTRIIPADPDEPFLFEPGDRVAFERISLDELPDPGGVEA